LSTSEDEIREYLEGKKLKNIVLPQDSNSIDQGEANAKEVKLGQKSLARAEYIQERDRKIQYGDRAAINEFMTEQTELRQKLEAQRERSRLEYDLIQEEKARLAKEARITQADRDKEKEDLEKLERRRDKEVANLLGYFNCPEEEWQKWLSDNHEPEESPANVLIARTDNGIGYCCGLHKYKYNSCSAFEIKTIENHFRIYEPEVHKAAIIDTINEKYDKLIQERKEKTLENKEVVFKRELRQIDSIKTRSPGDMTAPTKISKNERARIRREEEKEQEKNRRIYGGLY